jgi:membrane protein DedA with SNARE-associated domain
LKKANKKISPKKNRNAQSETKKTSAQFSRVASREEDSRLRGAEQTSPSQVARVESQPKPERSNLRLNALRVVVFLVVIGITLYIYQIRDHVADFESFGYPGIFLIALIANATILVPAPGVAIVYAMGAVFNPIGVGIAAGTGGAIGELSGYLAGFSGQAIVENSSVYERVKPWIDKYGAWAILALAAFPNPFFDTAGIAAGAAKMPILRFLVFCWIGQLIKMTVFAVAGYYSIEWISNLIIR